MFTPKTIAEDHCYIIYLIFLAASKAAAITTAIATAKSSAVAIAATVTASVTTAAGAASHTAALTAFASRPFPLLVAGFAAPTAGTYYTLTQGVYQFFCMTVKDITTSMFRE